jgi:hypothetical protein
MELSTTSYESSHLQLKRNELFFSEIAPIWSGRLIQAKDKISPISITRLKWYQELKNSSSCVVGEAHGFSADYVIKCRECNKLAWRFMFFFLIQSDSRIERTIVRFVHHWNKEHCFKSNIRPRSLLQISRDTCC